MTVADQPLVLQFSEGRYVTPTVSPKPSGKGSWVYVWVRSKSGLVVYVGETSQDLVLRLRRSIGELAHTTLAQLRNNASITNLDLEQDFTVYAFPLESPRGASAQTIKNYRRSVEAWVHWLICVGHRKHDATYCGFKYDRPNGSDRRMAASIVNVLASQCGWAL